MIEDCAKDDGKELFTKMLGIQLRAQCILVKFLMVVFSTIVYCTEIAERCFNFREIKQRKYLQFETVEYIQSANCIAWQKQ